MAAQAPIDAPSDDIALKGALITQKYRVEKILGKGGMGVVVSAIHEHLRERVAIKLIRRGAIGERDAVARFLREARAVVKIKSPYVARVLDVDTQEDGMPFMVMEYLEGRDLAKELAARGPLPVEETVDYFLQACLALAEAHDLGIVHRDIKPSNLFLAQNMRGGRQLKVLDFGISKVLGGSSIDTAETALTAPLSVMGSPSYMSPEQIRDAKDVDERTDIWSLGVILYELLSGKRPFRGASTTAILAAICVDDPMSLRVRREDIPIEIDQLVARCLAKSAAERPQSILEVSELLQPFASPRMQTVLAHAPEVPISRPFDSAHSEEALMRGSQTFAEAHGRSQGALATGSGLRTGVRPSLGADVDDRETPTNLKLNAPVAPSIADGVPSPPNDRAAESRSWQASPAILRKRRFEALSRKGVLAWASFGGALLLIAIVLFAVKWPSDGSPAAGAQAPAGDSRHEPLSPSAAPNTPRPVASAPEGGAALMAASAPREADAAPARPTQAEKPKPIHASPRPLQAKPVEASPLPDLNSRH